MSNSPSDPLASLHKMSRTAGLGSQDYVAVNPAAVVALILGLASGLAVMGTILLIIPAVAVVVSIISFVQIGRSAGTQTGKTLAALGLLFALGCVFFIGGREVLHAKQVSQAEGEIDALIDQFGKDLNQTNYEAAWSLLSPRLQERVSKQAWFDQLAKMQASPYYGQMKSMRSNGVLDVEIDPDTGIAMARGLVIIDLPQGRQARYAATFRKESSGWMFEEIDQFFPAPPPPSQAGPTVSSPKLGP